MYIPSGNVYYIPSGKSGHPMCLLYTFWEVRSSNVFIIYLLGIQVIQCVYYIPSGKSGHPMCLLYTFWEVRSSNVFIIYLLGSQVIQCVYSCTTDNIAIVLSPSLSAASK